MRRLGLLGGMSWESTAEYYRQVNRGIAARLGGLHSADLVMVSVDFASIERLQAEGRWEDAGALLAGEAARLESAGAEAVLICTNTMHLVAPAVEAAIGVPLLHVGDATAEAILDAGARRVGLLGTAFTMERPFLRDRLADRGVETIVPDAADRAETHRVIFEELCVGRLEPASRTRLLEISARLVAQGAEGIVLGCTELELLLDPDATPEASAPLFATARLHSAAAVEFALAGCS